ncbi:MAG: hypothetical protein V1769_01680 [Thermoplasmatota archaeon]
MILRAKNSTIAFLIITFFFIHSFPTIVYAEPIIEEVYCSPDQPIPLSTVSFTVGVNASNNSVDEVCLIIQECINDMCSINSKNISMDYSYSCCIDFYYAEFTLEQHDATLIEYHLELLSNGSWYVYSLDTLALASDHEVLNNDDVVELSSPGFEMILVMLVIFSYACIRKK